MKYTPYTVTYYNSKNCSVVEFFLAYHALYELSINTWTQQRGYVWLHCRNIKNGMSFFLNYFIQQKWRKYVVCVCVSETDGQRLCRQIERERERESDVLLTPSVCIAGRLLCLTEYTLKNNCIGNLNSLK